MCITDLAKVPMLCRAALISRPFLQVQGPTTPQMDNEGPLPRVTMEPDLQMHPAQRLQAVMEQVGCGLWAATPATVL